MVCSRVNFTLFIPDLTNRDSSVILESFLVQFFFLLLSVIVFFVFIYICIIINCEYQHIPIFHARTRTHTHTKAAYGATHFCSNCTSAYEPTVLIFNICRLHIVHAIWLVFLKCSQLPPSRSLFLPTSFQLTERCGVNVNISLSFSICPELEFGLESIYTVWRKVLHANAGILPPIKPQPFYSTSFKLIISNYTSVWRPG
jgi:hypothetical protein